MTIDEAIEYYSKAATQRAIADEEMGVNDKWNETKFMTKKESEQIIADNRQLVKWLTELNDWKEDPFSIIAEVCGSVTDCRRCQWYEKCPFPKDYRTYPEDWRLKNDRH